MLRRIILSLVILVNYAVPVSYGNDINGLISEFKSQTCCSSVSAVVYDHGELTYYGDSTSLYQIGSMTKSFTGLGVQKLISRGVISNTDKVSDLIPGFTAYYGSSEASITVEDLLTHRSGFTNSETDYPSASADMDLNEWAMSISGRQLMSMPGSEYAYSNVNYNLLGLIIENVTGMPYREYMEAEVLGPLCLDSTFAGVPENTDRTVEGTRLGFRNVFEYWLPVREASIPAGYFYSDTKDIGLWMKAWIEGLDPDMEAVIGRLENEGDCYAGLERFEGDVTGHSGGTPNYSSRFVFSRSEEVGVCVLANLNVAATTDSLCNNIFSALCGHEDKALVCDVWTVFDIIFTSVSVIGIVLFILAVLIRKKGVLIAIASTLALIEILILVLFPVIFGAGIKDIALTWAPLSFLTGMMILAVDCLSFIVKLCVVKVNEGRAKTG
ncbi:MAG: beta-lactamase family protein [Saccharofermentans sp.]|nr:beta-lactamase family protein [Saccharofermentans sp.]